MLKVTNNNIVLTRGDSGVFKLDVQDAEQQEYDFSGDTVVMTVKKSCTDKQHILQKTFDESGQVVFSPEDTQDLPMGDYVYDVQLTHVEEAVDPAEDDVVTVDTIITPHTFTLGAEVTY